MMVLDAGSQDIIGKTCFKKTRVGQRTQGKDYQEWQDMNLNFTVLK